MKLSVTACCKSQTHARTASPRPGIFLPCRTCLMTMSLQRTAVDAESLGRRRTSHFLKKLWRTMLMCAGAERLLTILRRLLALLMSTFIRARCCNSICQPRRCNSFTMAKFVKKSSSFKLHARNVVRVRRFLTSVSCCSSYCIWKGLPRRRRRGADAR
jgi:hypothetical protein